MLPELKLPGYSFRIREEKGKTCIFDEIRKKYVALTPEEWVRQHFIFYLSRDKNYPASLMVVERAVRVNRNLLRADLLVCSRNGCPLLVAEFKAPSVKVSQAAFDQLARYNMKLRVPYLVVSNGICHYCCRIDFLRGEYEFLNDIPDFDQLTGAEMSE
ncbi:MAG: type I restriction enzyme HsdR N-terminal domain-containing protein [Mangrovibacterium sp.]